MLPSYDIESQNSCLKPHSSFFIVSNRCHFAQTNAFCFFFWQPGTFDGLFMPALTLNQVCLTIFCSFMIWLLKKYFFLLPFDFNHSKSCKIMTRKQHWATAWLIVFLVLLQISYKCCLQSAWISLSLLAVFKKQN